MTKSEIISAAKRWMANELRCSSSDFDRFENTVTLRNANRRFFKMVTFGGGVCICADSAVKDWCDDFFAHMNGVNCFELPALLEIDKFLRGHRHILSVNSEMYLPDPSRLPPENTDIEIKWFERGEIPALYSDRRFLNALTYGTEPERPDVLAAGVYDNGELAALSGVCYENETFCQLGIEVLPSYQNRGFGSCLISAVTREVLSRDALPCYGTWCSNIASRRLAAKCGYFPAWVETHSV